MDFSWCRLYMLCPPAEPRWDELGALLSHPTFHTLSKYKDSSVGGIWSYKHHTHSQFWPTLDCPPRLTSQLAQAWEMIILVLSGFFPLVHAATSPKEKFLLICLYYLSYDKQICSAGEMMAIYFTSSK